MSIGVYDLGYAVGALTSWGMVLFGLYRLWQARGADRGRAALTGAFFFSAVGQMVEVSAVADHLNALSGIANLNRLTAYVCATGIGVSEAVLVLYWVPPEQARNKLPRRLAFYALCIAGYLVTFTIGNHAAAPHHFTVEHAASPPVAVFLFIYVAVQISYLGDVARVAWRVSHVTQQPAIRIGLRLVATGGAIGCAEALNKATFTLATIAGAHPTGEEAIAATLDGVASLFLLSGWATASMEPRFAAARDWVARYRGQRALYPLWISMYRAIPAIALDPPTSRWRAVWDPRDVKLRTLRRMIEIRDGRLSIAPYINPGVTATARRLGMDAGLSGEDLDAVVEAAQIRTGLWALAERASPFGATDVPPITGFHEIAAELHWLTRVAVAFTDSPVAAAAADLHADGVREIAS
jgi:hypothetical protein